MERCKDAVYNTCSVKILSSVVAASAHSPGCTLDVCNMVLRVAVSHRKRLAMGSWLMGLTV